MDADCPAVHVALCDLLESYGCRDPRARLDRRARDLFLWLHRRAEEAISRLLRSIAGCVRAALGRAWAHYLFGGHKYNAVVIWRQLRHISELRDVGCLPRASSNPSSPCVCSALIWKGKIVAGELGFEPRLTESEFAVLPLNYSPPGRRRPAADRRGGPRAASADYRNAAARNRNRPGRATHPALRSETAASHHGQVPGISR